jgi:hypothetical protein
MQRINNNISIVADGAEEIILQADQLSDLITVSNLSNVSKDVFLNKLLRIRRLAEGVADFITWVREPGGDNE